jgi:hypothetical protein
MRAFSTLYLFPVFNMVFLEATTKTISLFAEHNWSLLFAAGVGPLYLSTMNS